MIKKLFETQFRVHLTSEHPKYGEYGFGLLCFWLYAEDAKTAVDIARVWARFLPYKLGAGKSFPIEEDTHLEPYEIDCAVNAMTIGASLAFLHWPKDADESKVFGIWPYLVPPMNLAS